MRTLSVFLAGVTLLSFSSVAFAQSVAVAGRVADTQGAVIANAEITLRALPPPGTPARMPAMPGMDGSERTTQSRADGTFSFDGVPSGEYALYADFSGFERSSQLITVANQPVTVSLVLELLELPGAEPRAADAGAPTDTQALLNRIKVLEQRINELESTTVLSEPETRVKRIEVYVDPDGVQYDQP